MKTFVHRDADGNIYGVVTCDAPAGVQASLRPAAGITVTEVEGLGLTGDSSDVAPFQKLAASKKVLVKPRPLGRLGAKD